MDASIDSLLRASSAGGGALDAYGGAGVVLLGVFSWGPGRGATWLMAKSSPQVWIHAFHGQSGCICCVGTIGIGHQLHKRPDSFSSRFTPGFPVRPKSIRTILYGQSHLVQHHIMSITEAKDGLSAHRYVVH